MTRFTASVHLRHTDGSVRRITPEDGLFYQASIASRPDRVVYYGATSGFPRLWCQSVEGKEPPVPLTPRTHGARHPSFDWVGNRIVFASDSESPVPGETVETINATTRHVAPGIQMHLYSCNADGSDMTQLTEGPYVDHRPSFSPDGRWVVFASDRDGVRGIWRTPINGHSDPQPVLTRMWAYRPWYTPGGDTILVYGPDGDRDRIWKIEVSSGAVTPLGADDSGMTHGPFVQPGQNEVVLTHSTRDGRWALWEFPLHSRGPAPRNVTPKGVDVATHGTRAENGTLAFDVVTMGRVPQP